MNYGYMFLIFLVTHEWSKSVFVLEGPGPTLVPPPASCEAWSFPNTRGGLRVNRKDFVKCMCSLPSRKPSPSYCNLTNKILTVCILEVCGLSLFLSRV